MKLIELEDKIFIAGHKGMAGRAILKAFENKGYHNFLLESKDKLNLKDSEAVDYWFSKNKPQVVILAAAKVGGIFANNSYPYDFLLDNLKINTNVI